MKLKKILFSSGMVAVVFYTLHVVLGGMLWMDYRHLQQPISDLTATGAPNRDLLLALTTLYGVLALIFAIAFTAVESRKHHRLVFWGGISFIVMHAISLSYGFFPQDLAGSPATLTGIMHLVVTALIVPFAIASPLLIGFGLKKEPAWKSVGIYSIVTGFLILIFGSLCGIFFANKLPYFGLVERLNIGALQVWTLILSLQLLRKS